MNLLEILGAIVGWCSLAVSVGGYCWIAFKAFVLKSWLWSLGCILLPIPMIPIFAYLHWPETHVGLMVTLGAFLIFMGSFLLIMNRGRGVESNKMSSTPNSRQ